jgi:hypothetical protein
VVQVLRAFMIPWFASFMGLLFGHFLRGDCETTCAGLVSQAPAVGCFRFLLATSNGFYTS